MNANKVKKSYVKSALAGAASAAVIAFASAPAMAQATETVEFDIPAQDLSAALNAYGRQSGKEIAFSPDAVKGKRLTVALRGDYAPDAALDKILSDTGLEHRMSDADIIVVSDPGAKRAEAENNQGSFRVAQLDQEDSGDVARVSDRGAGDDDEDAQDVVVVTGTRIKGVKDQFSPVTQVSREDMDLAGFANVADVVESLPQNFGGGITADTTGANNLNGQGGSSVNLRGLGNQATLILLNGRRLASGGALGDFVDISTIPTSAIDRVEVLTDGASAIYGSDAIAGVVNIILRDDFDGAETRLNVGTITDGGGDYLKAAQTLGWSGDRAHAMVTYEYSVEEELNANDKEFAASATDPTWLLPFTQKHSVFASSGIELSDRVKLSADGYFNDRKSKQFTSSDSLSVFEAFQVTKVQQYGGALGLDIAISENWDANLSGSYSKSDQFSDNIRTNGSGEEYSAVTEIFSVDGSIGGSLFAISDAPVKGVVGMHYRSEKSDLLSIRTPAGNATLDSDKSRDVFAAFGEIYAPLVTSENNLPGIESLALSMSARYENYSDVGSSLDPKFGLSWEPVSGLNLRGTYSTSFRAPRLDQLFDNVGAVILNVYVDPMSTSGESIALLATGTTDDLDPETSETWTAGFDFAPEALSGFVVRGTYFNTVFSNQVGFPLVSLDSSFRFVDFTGVPERGVGQDVFQDLCARATLGCVNYGDFFPSLGVFTIADVEVFLDNRAQNLSRSKVEGIDLESSYQHASPIGDWRFSLSGTLLTTFEQQIAPAAPPSDLLNTYGNPIDLRLRGGVQLRSGALNTAIFVNHVGDYIDDEQPAGDAPIKSFTTVDASIRLDIGELLNNPVTNGASLSFSVLNIFNEDPPYIEPTPTRTATFDAANASPAGRKIGLLLVKRW